MTEEKRFEDKLSIADLMKKSQKELIANIYQQVVKTNGIVRQNCGDIEELKTEMKDKIGLKLFRNLTIILGLLITIATLLGIFIGR